MHDEESDRRNEKLNDADGDDNTHAVADWKAITRALRESEEKFSKAFRACPHPIGVTELASGRLVEINGSFERTFGLTREQALGRTTVELGMWANAADRTRFAQLMKDFGSVSELPISARHQNGRVLLTRFSSERVVLGDVVHVVTFVRDVTEQVRAESALRESEEKFATAFRASPYAMAILESEGHTLDFNENFERLLNCKRSEVVGTTVFELGLATDPVDRAEVQQALQGQSAVRDLAVFVQPRSGAGRDCLLSAEPIELGGKPCFVVILRDVTEQLNAELVRIELEAQLRQAQKLEALGTLAGGIAHDFNNVLGAIVAYGDLIEFDLESPDSIREHLRELRQATARATDLVRQILTFSRRKKQERRPTRLDAVTREVLNLLRSSLPSTIQFDTCIEADAPVVLADPSQVHQVLMNLATNAAHAMRGTQGRLTIRLDSVVVEAGAASSPTDVRPGRYARLLVRDSGSGMDADTQKRIFEPFFTTKGPGEGTGLGLAVVQGIVSEHDGHIAVDSRVGEGTVFSLLFPEHSTHLDETHEPPVSLPRGRGERILVVDDERLLCDSLALLLERLGYRVTTRSDPVEALELFVADPMRFDLVLADLTMPAMTGADLARAVLDIRPRTRVVMMTGFSGTWTSDALRSVGVQELIPKPITVEALASVMRTALESPPIPGVRGRGRAVPSPSVLRVVK